MEYLPLFLLFLAVLIAAYFYLQRAKARDAGKRAAAEQQPQEPQQTTTTTESEAAPSPPADRAE